KMENITLIDELEDLKREVEENKGDVAFVAANHEMSPGYLKAQLKILDLPEDVKQLIRDGKIKRATAIVLTRLWEDELKKFIELVMEGKAKFSVDDVEKFKKAYREAKEEEDIEKLS
ncbi:MAG: hypothetical protein ACTSPG_10165, partial [Candidatus Hodarchaeales archaeon]